MPSYPINRPLSSSPRAGSDLPPTKTGGWNDLDAEIGLTMKLMESMKMDQVKSFGESPEWRKLKRH